MADFVNPYQFAEGLLQRDNDIGPTYDLSWTTRTTHVHVNRSLYWLATIVARL